MQIGARYTLKFSQIGDNKVIKDLKYYLLQDVVFRITECDL